MDFKVLFSGKDVEVRYRGNGAKFNVVVFRCAGNLPLILKDGQKIEPEWPYFLNLEGAFASDDTNEYYVDAFHQHLYQTQETKDAIKIIKDHICANSISVVTFGLSMGASAAVDFSKDLNATFVALSPAATYSGLLPLAPRSKRMQQEYLYPQSNIEKGLLKQAKGYLFFDYYSKIDCIHAYYIKHHSKACIINEPFWGHSNAHKLNEVEKLKDLVHKVLDKTFNISDIKKKISKSYYSKPHQNYINFIIDKYFHTERKKSLEEFLKDKIDINNIQNIHVVAEKLRNINKMECFQEFVKKAISFNPTNKKSIMFKNEMEVYESIFNRNEISNLDLLQKCHYEKIATPYIYLIYSTLLEFSGDIERAIYIINDACKIYPNDFQLKARKGCLKLRTKYMNIIKDAQSLFGKYMVIDKKIFELVPPNQEKIECGISLKNIESDMFLRHKNGKIETNEFENSEVFKYDSTFIPFAFNDSTIALKCTNLNMPNIFLTRNDGRYSLQFFNNQNQIQDMKFSIVLYR